MRNFDHRAVRRLLLAGASIPMLWIATPTVAAAAEAAATTGSVLDEVVVTGARRREEKLQDVPQAVTSISGEKLEVAGIANTQSLAQVTPGLNFGAQGSVGQPNIRGVGTNNTGNGDESNVSVYVDGIYQPDMFSSIFSLANVERVEVLKGPQGTLFGRNSTGGSIAVTTKAPQRTFSAEATAGYGNLKSILGSLYVTGPITDKIAADIVFSYEDDDGYVTDINTGGRLATSTSITGRSKVLWDITDTSKLTVGIAYSFEKTNTGLSGRPINDNTIARQQNPPIRYPTEPYTASPSYAPINDILTWQGFIRYEKDFGWASFSSQTSHVHARFHSVPDSDYTPLLLSVADTHSVTETIQQEFLFNSPSESKIQWVGGLFLYHATGGYQPRIANNVRTYAIMTTNSAAPFGELTYPITDRFSITGGLRYTWEKRKIAGNTGTNPIRTDAVKSSQLTPRVVLQYKIPDQLNFYGSYAKGFKSGVYNTAALPAAPTPLQYVTPEKIDAFEIGVKSLFPGPLRFDLNAFHYDYKDVQLTTFQPPSSSALLNAAREKIYGAEGSVTGRVTSDLQLTGFVGYTHSRYAEFTNAIVNVPNPNGRGGNIVRQPVDVSGNPTIRTPEWTAGVGAIYTHEFGGGDLTLTSNYYYNGGFPFEYGNRHRQGAYNTLAATASWSPEGGAYKITVWGANLTNEVYALTGSATSFGDIVAYAKPRTYGVRFSAKFE